MTNKPFVVRNGLAVNTNSTNTTATFSGTDGIKLPSGNTGQRVAEAGVFRYNSETSNFEGYDGSTWTAVAAADGFANTLADGNTSAPGTVFSGSDKVGFALNSSTDGIDLYYRISSVTVKGATFGPTGLIKASALMATSDLTANQSVSGESFRTHNIADSANIALFNSNTHGIRIAANTITTEIISGEDDGTGSSNLMIRSAALTFANSSATLATLAANGNLGIGTAVPGNKVTVANSSGEVYSNWTNGTGNLFAGINGSHNGVFGTTSTSQLYFYTNNTVKATLSANGNFGIGNSEPTVTLHVNGSSASNVGTLADAANVTVNLANYNNWTLTLGGNRNIDNPTGLVPGQSGVIFIIQDSTGSRTLSWSSFWKFPGGTAPTLSTTANTVDAVMYTVRSTTSIAAKELLNLEVI